MSKKNIENIVRENTVVMILRITLGLAFILSSVGKGIDPTGTAYRVEDYLGAYNLLWLHGYELTISFFLIIVEFLIGIALVFKLHAKLAAIGVLFIMIFFTIITYIDASQNLVPDCGCFGDAVKLTAWETFYKNIVLIILAIIVFAFRKKMTLSMPGWLQSVVLIIFTSGYLWFMSYSYNHLPVVDFRDWEIGRDMKTENEGNEKTYLVYQNKETGEFEEYISPNYPWNDSVWMSEWEFVDQRLDDSDVIKKHNLVIESFKGVDFTKVLVENSNYQLLLISYDLDKANGEGMLKASELAETLLNQPVSIALITASGPETIGKYWELYKMWYLAYLADDIELKAMIRSNPGLVLLKNGIVIDKWHYNDFPTSWKEAVIK